MGTEKCNVMRIGKHCDETREWKIGDMPLEETVKYKYLGDVVTADVKNTENLKARNINLQATTVIINTIPASEVLQKIETSVLLEMHNKKSMSGFLTNAESWNLSKGEESDLERMKIQALKSLFDLPIHTLTVAIIYTFGLLYTTQQIDKKQLIYLYKVLNQSDEDSTKKALGINEDKIGWSRNI